MDFFVSVYSQIITEFEYMSLIHELMTRSVFHVVITHDNATAAGLNGAWIRFVPLPSSGAREPGLAGTRH